MPQPHELTERAHRLQELARGVAGLTVKSRETQAVLGFLLGALYPLWHANALEFSDRSGKRLRSDNAAKLRRIAQELSSRPRRRPYVSNEKDWCASLWFNNAVLRLDSVRLRFKRAACHARTATPCDA
jgi:hypothetical protein